ncbi:MAG: precorrin-6y C5,15-methyltransferase (decarboxylating) subunit CbiE, partial [Deltaproteobacteria bacterium]|nr:precorrin-6y C5,15-methyltransferase (decarboxylating) subunit CbiE [Deltaproteobacteria bacterium]
SQRLKDLFPECPAKRIDSGVDVAGILDVIASHRDAGQQVVLLATGDPGIASLAQPVIRRFGRENCEVVPGISSIQVAFARLGLDWIDARIITAHRSDPEETPAELRGSPKLAILGGRDGSLRWAAGIIPELGEGRRVFLCEDLTMPTERVREVSAGDLMKIPVSARAIILVIRKELMS